MPQVTRTRPAGRAARGVALCAAGLAVAFAMPSAPAAGAQTAAVTRVKISGTVRNSGFGTSVAISGTTAVIGANFQGAAQVYTEQAGAWQLDATLVPKPAASNFGVAVAISGGTIAVGAAQNRGPGLVYVFSRSGGTWAQTAEFQASDAASGDQFGGALSLSRKDLLVGAPSSGKAYVFTDASGSWAQAAELTATDGKPADGFGGSVALSGSTALVGAPGRQSQNGAAYVFTGASGSWAQRAELTPAGPGSGERFGASVALASGTALIGAPQQNQLTGAAYVFTGAGRNWAQEAELPGPVNSPVSFGAAVAVEPGTAVVINNAAPDGDAYVYQGSGSSWTLAHRVGGPVGPDDGLFEAAAISGTTAIVGVPSLGTWRGGAYVFSPV